MSTSDSNVELPPSVAQPLVPIPDKLPLSRARRAAAAKPPVAKQPAEQLGATKRGADNTIEGEAAPGTTAQAQAALVKSDESKGTATAAAVPKQAPKLAPNKRSAAKAPAAHSGEELSEDAVDEAEAVPASGRSWRRWLAATPSWLVSTVVHLAAIILLATFTIVNDEKATAFFIQGNLNEDAEPLLIEPTSFVAEMKSVSDVAAHTVNSESLGFTDLGDVTEAAQSTVAVGSGDLEVSPVGEIGDIFGSKGQGMASTGVTAGSAEFFGVKAAGRKFVFIVDSSNSMRNGKFTDAKQELMYAVQRLTKDQFFYIIFFDHDAERMKLYPSGAPEEKPVRATLENMKLAERWVHTVENERKTDPYDAVKYAIEMLPDAIYLLSDGQFTDKGKTVAYLKANNILDDPIDGRRPKVVIHTVGFYSQEGEENLKAIAKAYGGTYRFVPKPKK